MKLHQSIFAIGVALLASNSCVADTKMLFEYNHTSYDDSLADISPAALSFGIDHQINDNFSVIAKYGFGIQDDSQTTLAGETSFGIDNLYGIYFKGSMQMNDAWHPYALIGYTKTQLTAKVSGADFTQSDEGFSYGIGMDYQVSERLKFNFDYSKLIDKSELDLSAINAGLSFSF